MVTFLVWTLDGYDLAFVSLRDLPIVFVHPPVMSMTEKDKVLEICRPSVYPVHEVMSIAP
jgi:hypothetical protein